MTKNFPQNGEKPQFTDEWISANPNQNEYKENHQTLGTS